MQKRYNWIDYGKVIAIFLVVLTHVLSEGDAQWLQDVNKVGCSVHVPFFFFISGYLFRVKEDNFGKYCMDSFKSLLLPYIFFNVVSAVLVYRLVAHDVFVLGISDFLLGKGHSFAGPAWFLVTLFAVRLFAFFLHKIQKGFFVWLLVLLGIVVVMVLPFIPFGISSGLFALPLFRLGEEIKRHRLVDAFMKITPPYAKICVAMVLVGLCVLLRDQPSIDWGRAFVHGNIFLAYAHVLFSILMLFSVCSLMNNYSSMLLRRMSASTISIMGFHITILQLIWAYKGKLPNVVQFLFESPMLPVTVFCISFVVSLFLMRCCPKMIGNRK